MSKIIVFRFKSIYVKCISSRIKGFQVSYRQTDKVIHIVATAPKIEVAMFVKKNACFVFFVFNIKAFLYRNVFCIAYIRAAVKR